MIYLNLKQIKIAEAGQERSLHELIAFLEDIKLDRIANNKWMLLDMDGLDLGYIDAKIFHNGDVCVQFKPVSTYRHLASKREFEINVVDLSEKAVLERTVAFLNFGASIKNEFGI